MCGINDNSKDKSEVINLTNQFYYLILHVTKYCENEIDNIKSDTIKQYYEDVVEFGNHLKTWYNY